MRAESAKSLVEGKPIPIDTPRMTEIKKLMSMSFAGIVNSTSVMTVPEPSMNKSNFSGSRRKSHPPKMQRGKGYCKIVHSEKQFLEVVEM